jgi:excisionase family DNA binding protein
MERKAKSQGSAPARSGTTATDGLLTSAEVAALFGVDRRTVVLWAKRGRLPALRTPGGQHRFRADEIRRLLETSTGSTNGETASE